MKLTSLPSFSACEETAHEAKEHLAGEKKTTCTSKSSFRKIICERVRGRINPGGKVLEGRLGESNE